MSDRPGAARSGTPRAGRPRTRRIRTGPRRGPAAVLVALGLVLTMLTGCSGRDTDAAGAPQTSASLPKYYDAQALLAAVGNRERADGGALMTLHGTLDPPASPPSVPDGPPPSGRLAITGDGALRYADGTSSVRFDQRLGATNGPTRSTGVIHANGRTWLRLPGAAPEGWTEVGRADIAPADRVDGALATDIAGTADPLTGVSRYADASLVADAADEPVQGRPTVRYTIVVDLVRAAAIETDPGLRTQLTAQVDGGLTRISTTVWVDGEQRPVRGRTRQEVPGAGTLDLVTDYHAWGTAVTVDPPPGS